MRPAEADRKSNEVVLPLAQFPVRLETVSYPSVPLVLNAP